MRKRRRWRAPQFFAACGLALAFAVPSAIASPSDPLAQVRRVLATPDAQLDLARAKIAIDRLIDPRTDEAVTLRQLDSLTRAIQARIPVGASRREKLRILVDSLAQPGPWNDARPFRYDLDDPFGEDIRNKLLATYLATRKGNCVSMPILFAILAQRIGLDASLAVAPHHLFARAKVDGGQWVNIEATSFGTKTDDSYRKELNITATAIKSGIYLRTLSPKESLGVTLETLLEHYSKSGANEQRLAVADMVLKSDPRNVSAILHRGSACGRLARKRYDGQPQQALTPAQQQDLAALASCNSAAFAKAEALGWRAEQQKEKAKYRRGVNQAKLNQGRNP
ncbi:hypothetical protein J5226_21305 [Lysobacter sp. K5869]|uniref:transglutaminase family protein n=1 Tax=Lysobacter sp. K5869 TaxID=2820808 RepID=UPI001C061701|nr:transglutaminase family protein [Lysobacter sp. K5869]QWP76103.1 hypothetical protein J5226_21305 [Lysobacter sp. K5869]